MKIQLIGLMLCLFATENAMSAPNHKVVWEAESFSSLHPPLRHIKDKRSRSNKFSGSGYLQMAWNKHHAAGRATYKFKVPYPGFYYVWLRTKWQDNLTNLVYVSVNGRHPRYVGNDATYEMWHWVTGVGGRLRVRCHTGTNTLVLQDMEMGVKIDQILLTSDPEYIPTGIQ
jgi:hypothetical protein